MMKSIRIILYGFSTLTIFPRKLEPENEFEPFKILSDQEAFEADLTAVGNDMWNAIRSLEKNGEIHND